MAIASCSSLGCRGLYAETEVLVLISIEAEKQVAYVSTVRCVPDLDLPCPGIACASYERRWLASSPTKVLSSSDERW